MWQTVKERKQMLSNIIDGSDRTDHFDRIIPIQVDRNMLTIYTIIRLTLGRLRGTKILR